jgi:hypothetical protein
VCWRRRRGYIGAREGTILEEERSLRWFHSLGRRSTFCYRYPQPLLPLAATSP